MALFEPWDTTAFHESYGRLLLLFVALTRFLYFDVFLDGWKDSNVLRIILDGQYVT